MKIEIKSILEKVLSELNATSDFAKAKELVVNSITNSKINEQDKKKMLLDVKYSSNHSKLVHYVYNAILKYEGYGVINKSLSGGEVK